MTVAEKRTKLAALHLQMVRQKNIYSQNAVKRECALKKHTDGKYYSDCSSATRKATEEADPDTRPLGGNTVAQYQNKKAKVVNCKIVNGVPTDISALRVGDCLYFAGTDASRAYADYVGHVEQIHKISGNKVTLFGHGSGNPKLKDMATYCKSRQNAKTKTKKGNKGLLKVLRFIADDGTTNEPETPAADKLGDRLLKYGARGDDVKELQRLLREIGLFGGAIGGNYLAITTAAVKAFQEQVGLKVDGEYGPDTHKALMGYGDRPAAKQYIVVKGNTVNVRTGPGASYASYDGSVARRGDRYEYTGVTQNGWYQIIYKKGDTAWISGYDGLTEIVK